MLPRCPNPQCPDPDPRKNGTYFRPSDSKSIQRWRCLTCHRHFSAATFQAPYRQNKRRVNPQVAQLLCSGVSQRRIALLLSITRVTVARKLAFLAQKAQQRQAKWLKSQPKVTQVQFDDLITLEHTQCKPLALSLAIEAGTRKILGFEVSALPASGPLAAFARNKYGPRPNGRPLALRRLFETLKQAVDPAVAFQSDEDPLYPPLVRRHFPGAKHVRHKGGRGCISGQGELKKLVFDPLFSLNHTCAMLRANINRLFRRTWCTTKKAERLRQHVAVYVEFHNTVLLKA